MRLREIVAAAKGEKLPSSTRTQLNNAIHGLTQGYHQGIPLGKITEALKKKGAVILQEDNTEWSGMLTGREGKMTVDMAPISSGVDQHGHKVYTPYTNTMLVLTWHKMESGKYEVVCYVS